MLRTLYSLITIAVIISNTNNQSLLDILKDNNHWVVINSRVDSIQVYEKNIPNMELNALKVEKVISFKRDLIENIIMDINKYPNIMSNEDMISLNLGEGNNIIFGYNHFSFPLPFINDRHYFFKLIKESKTTISWILLSKQECWEKIKSYCCLHNLYYLNYQTGMYIPDGPLYNLLITELELLNQWKMEHIIYGFLEVVLYHEVIDRCKLREL